MTRYASGLNGLLVPALEAVAQRALSRLRADL
jgi:hypothetical protein